MVAFGGAGPLMAALIAEEIAIDNILVPPFPGALSALGAARADIAGDLVKPVYARLHRLSAAALTEAYEALQREAEKWIADQSAGADAGPFRASYTAEMRYEGQGYDVPVPLGQDWLASGDRDSIATAFHAAHRGVYGHATEANEVWLKELRVHLSGAIPRPPMRAVRVEATEPGSRRAIRLSGRTVEAAILSRAALVGGDVVQGPAILNQMDTTTLIPPGWQASLAPLGALILSHVEMEPQR
jgi:N-methylhydantoinase A